MPRKTVHCWRLVKKLVNQCSNEPSIAWHCKFSNSRSWGTKSNAFEKSLNIRAVSLGLFLDDVQSSKQQSSWVRIDFPLRKPNLTTRSLTIFSLTLHAMEVREIWREFLVQSFLPFLWMGTMLAILQAYVTSPAKNDLLRSEQKVGEISITHFFNRRGGRWSGHGNVCGFRVCLHKGGGLPACPYNLSF